jgi:hypothetical protein
MSKPKLIAILTAIITALTAIVIALGGNLTL